MLRPHRAASLDAGARSSRGGGIVSAPRRHLPHYLAERGSKPAPLADIAALVSGVTGIRLAADAVLDLWDGNGAEGDRSAARSELTREARSLTGWYDHLAGALTGAEAVPAPLPADEVADGRLVDAVARDLTDPDGHATGTGVRIIWTGDHLDATRRLQTLLVEPARSAVSERFGEPSRVDPDAGTAPSGVANDPQDDRAAGVLDRVED